MKKTSKELVESTLEMHKDMNALTIDKIEETAPEAQVEELKLSKKEQAKMEGALYLEPIRRLRAIGTLPEKLKKDHARDWEYVKGMLENYIVNGEPVRFWYCGYPGDQDCMWEVPANKPVYVPRMIARHLAETMKYHTFGYIDKPQEKLRVDDHVEMFAATGTHYRAMFRPIGAFAA